ncbi:hypothetical protein IMSHALPRED_001648 [Imshaugia aleurites]|uniref:Uncharacterized protein n=1 Tax=Imshaugia aleurites TaxID=172621 RepID=A0A8H3J347_9LECA|nr:hypothetical protein IMSHALPRED_001648 [Imshaugia aleurites]
MTAMSERGGGVNLGVGGVNELSLFPSHKHRTNDQFVEEQMQGSWDIIVCEYTGRAMSEPTDKLIALAGIASQFSAYLGTTYLAGLWERNLVSQLLWYKQSIKPGEDGFTDVPEVYTAPSWSWASLNGPIGASHLSVPNETESRTIATDTRRRLKILGYKLELAEKAAPFGAVTSAELRVRGWLLKAQVTQSTSSLVPDEDHYVMDADLELQPWDLWELENPGYAESIGSAVLDDIGNYVEATEVYCLLVAKVYHGEWYVFRRIKNQERHTWKHWVLGGLLLVPDDSPGTYRRVGLFHIDPDYDDRFMCAAKQETLRLI